MTTITDSALLRLLQLSSAALPVGGYSFSQGLEYAIDAGWLKKSDDVALWLSQQMTQALASVDLPLLRRLMQAQANRDQAALAYWNAWALACRETAELRLTDTAMGLALIKLLRDLNVSVVEDVLDSQAWQSADQSRYSEQYAVSYLTAFAIAAEHWQLDTRTACLGYLWSWLENQVAAATKLVPLGQTAAQRLLGQLLEEASAAIDHADGVADDAIGSGLPALAMASSWHETQYSRLFRS